jgi:hypothetical protein
VNDESTSGSGFRVRIGRPRSARGWLGYGLLAFVLAIVLIGVLAVSVVGAALAYDQFGAHFARNARQWASLTPQYAADSNVCSSCHQTEFSKWQVSRHVVVGCQTCHGALAEHASTAPVPESAEAIDQAESGEASPLPLEGAPKPIPPTDSLCTVCHLTRVGHPQGFPTVNPAVHYPGTDCLQCHDVHTAVAIPPPTIRHSMTNLPPCTTCHGTSATNGVKAMPAGHKLSEDKVCLGCHKAEPGATPRPLPTTNP